jgi:hypothetical protein
MALWIRFRKKSEAWHYGLNSENKHIESSACNSNHQRGECTQADQRNIAIFSYRDNNPLTQNIAAIVNTKPKSRKITTRFEIATTG